MNKNIRTDNVALSLRSLVGPLLAALARLALVGTIAAWLLVVLLNEIAIALVYAIIAVLTLFMAP